MATIVKEPPITLREALLPYLVAGVNMLVPTIAARGILLPSVYMTAVAFILIGIPASLFFRQRGYNRILMNLLVIVPLLTITWSLVRGHPGFQYDWRDPVASALAGDSWAQLEAVLNVFVLLAAGRTFLIVAAEDLLQTPIPGIIIFLLTMITSEPDFAQLLLILALLLLFFASALYLLSHEHNRQWFASQLPVGFQRRLLAWSLLVSLLLFPPVAVLAQVMAPFNMFTLTRLGRSRTLPHWSLHLFDGNNLGIGFEDSLAIGGANWPGGKQLMMEVTISKDAPQNLLWRAGTYTFYQGGHWEVLHELPRFLRVAPTPDTPPDTSQHWSFTDNNGGSLLRIDGTQACSDPGIRLWLRERKLTAPTAEMLVKQQVRMHARATSARIPVHGAYQIYTVDWKGPGSRIPAVESDGAVYLQRQRPGSTPESYEVTSILKPLPFTWKLQGDPALPEVDRTQCLQIPGGPDGDLAHALRRKALAILAAGNAPVASMPADERARAIENYLSRTYRYTLQPKPTPPGRDPILDFLTTQKQGYCVYFASAMVLLCRSIGIPARFAVGFASGDSDMEQADNNAETITYRVTSEHAHAWAEVFLPHYGWYTSDPTAGSTEVPTLWGKTWDLISEVTNRVRAFIRDTNAYAKLHPEFRQYVIFGVFVLGLLVGLVLYLRRDRPPELPSRELTREEATHSVLDAYTRMHRWLRRWGVYKPDGYTALEFEHTFVEINPAMGAPVRELSRLYIRASYGDHPLDDADARRAVVLLQELWELARSERKNLHRGEAEL
jgi:transglutaminase-like putative cysteine protease